MITEKKAMVCTTNGMAIPNGLRSTMISGVQYSDALFLTKDTGTQSETYWNSILNVDINFNASYFKTILRKRQKCNTHSFHQNSIEIIYLTTWNKSPYSFPKIYSIVLVFTSSNSILYTSSINKRILWNIMYAPWIFLLFWRLNNDNYHIKCRQKMLTMSSPKWNLLGFLKILNSSTILCGRILLPIILCPFCNNYNKF